MTLYESYRRMVSRHLHKVFEPYDNPVYDLCAYHMGWTDESGKPLSGQAGKMIRPVLCLAACHGYANPERAVAVAAAVELLHAFSLAHDDIEDGDRERRHRPTLWSLFGVPLALNAGDALYALAVATLHDAVAALPGGRATTALAIFSSTCLRLVEGQHLDLEFERREDVGIADYLAMARGKTGALLGASLALGALFGGASEAAIERLRGAGVELGLAFQARDDALALWGDANATGKATGNDLARGKKSLPAVLAIERGLRLDRLESTTVEAVQHELARLGVREAVERFALARSASARRQIGEAGMGTAGREELLSLAQLAVARES